MSLKSDRKNNATDRRGRRKEGVRRILIDGKDRTCLIYCSCLPLLHVLV